MDPSPSYLKLLEVCPCDVTLNDTQMSIYSEREHNSNADVIHIIAV